MTEYWFQEYEAARKKFVEIKTEKDKVKKRLEEVRRQNAPMQKRLDEVTKKVRDLENSTRELVSEVRLFLYVQWSFNVSFLHIIIIIIYYVSGDDRHQPVKLPNH